MASDRHSSLAVPGKSRILAEQSRRFANNAREVMAGDIPFQGEIKDLS